MLELCVLFISARIKCVFSPSSCYIESLNCVLLRNKGSVSNSKYVLWTFDYSEICLITMFELCNSLYIRKVCWNEVCLDWLLILLQVCLYCHILIFPIKCAISPKLVMKNKITLFLSVDLNSLTTCAVYADLIPAVSGAVQCCLCMSGIQCWSATSAGRTGTVCYWWEKLWPWQLSPCKIYIKR